jgi:hypothetical protein
MGRHARVMDRLELTVNRCEQASVDFRREVGFQLAGSELPPVIVVLFRCVLSLVAHAGHKLPTHPPGPPRSQPTARRPQQGAGA